jgi:hypothetical protein
MKSDFNELSSFMEIVVWVFGLTLAANKLHPRKDIRDDYYFITDIGQPLNIDTICIFTLPFVPSFSRNFVKYNNIDFLLPFFRSKGDFLKLKNRLAPRLKLIEFACFLFHSFIKA